MSVCIDSEQPGVPSLTICTWYSCASWARPTPSVPAMESPTSRTLTGLEEVAAGSAGDRYEGTVVVVVVRTTSAAGTPGVAATVVDVVVEDGALTDNCE